MSGSENSKKPKKVSAPNSRDARLAAALRENLRRRKAQERGRDAQDKGEPATDDEKA
jgi:hypothetical protein